MLDTARRHESTRVLAPAGDSVLSTFTTYISAAGIARNSQLIHPIGGNLSITVQITHYPSPSALAKLGDEIAGLAGLASSADFLTVATVHLFFSVLRRARSY